MEEYKVVIFYKSRSVSTSSTAVSVAVIDGFDSELMAERAVDEILSSVSGAEALVIRVK